MCFYKQQEINKYFYYKSFREYIKTIVYFAILSERKLNGCTVPVPSNHDITLTVVTAISFVNCGSSVTNVHKTHHKRYFTNLQMITIDLISSKFAILIAIRPIYEVWYAHCIVYKRRYSHVNSSIMKLHATKTFVSHWRCLMNQ